MKVSRRVLAALLVVCALVTLAHVARYGMESSDFPTFYLVAALKHQGQFTLEPAASVMIPASTPPLVKLFVPVYDVPAFQLVAGLLARIVVGLGFAVLTYRLSGSVIAAALTVVLVFGLGDFLVLVVDLPLGTMSHFLRKPVAFTYRMAAMAFPLFALVAFLDRRHVLAGLLLGAGFYLHPLNMAMFAASFVVALGVEGLMRRAPLGALRGVLALALPMVAVAAPYVLRGATMFPDVVPIPSVEWWKLAMMNEPDDASVLFAVSQKGYLREAGMTVIAGLAWLAWRAERPVTARTLWAAARADRVIPVLLAPWVVWLAAAGWEAVLIPRVPDWMNDVFVPLMFRRVLTVGAFLYAAVLASLVAAAAMAAMASLRGTAWRTPGSDARAGMVVAAAILLFFAARNPSRLEAAAGFVSLEHRGDQFFMQYRRGVAYTSPPEAAASDVVVIPSSAMRDVGAFARRHTPVGAGFFNPPYLDMFMAYTERQGFLTEAEDGNFALFNRRFATLYLQRFADIHGGLRYEELPQPVANRGKAYVILRRKYLALDAPAIERLRRRYPGYRYFLTELGHELPYRVVHRNTHLVVYDLDGGPVRMADADARVACAPGCR